MSKKFEPTPYELMTHKGRQIDDATDPNYCGSCSIDIHCAQVRDPKSWVHSSIKRWEELGGPTQRPVETKYATIDRDELKRLQADSAELARMREPVDLVTVAYLHLDATIGGGWRVSGYPLSERKIYEGALQQPLVRLSDAQRAIAQARQVPEDVRRDANRYRWLRERYYAADFSYGASDGFGSIEAMVFKMPDGHVFTAGCDQTIDSAMLAAVPQGDSHE